jgi:hypothetical protein
MSQSSEYQSFKKNFVLSRAKTNCSTKSDKNVFFVGMALQLKSRSFEIVTALV